MIGRRLPGGPIFLPGFFGWLLGLLPRYLSPHVFRTPYYRMISAMVLSRTSVLYFNSSTLNCLRLELCCYLQLFLTPSAVIFFLSGFAAPWNGGMASRSLSMSAKYLEIIFRMSPGLVASFSSESYALRFLNVFWLKGPCCLKHSVLVNFLKRLCLQSLYQSISSIFSLICLSLMLCSILFLSVSNVDF